MLIRLWTYRRKSLSIFNRIGRPGGTSPPMQSSGFTLIEVVIVIAIVGALAGIAIPLYARHVDTANVSRGKAEIKNIEKVITIFLGENGRLPKNLLEVDLENILDPYGTPYQYQPSTYIDGTGTTKESPNRRKDSELVAVNTDFDLFSMGKDRLSSAPFTDKDSRDDIVRADNGFFIGLVSAY